MRIYDCVMLNDELDLLDLRLREIGNLVDCVVVVESTKTFKGEDKPLCFEDFVHTRGWNYNARYIVHGPQDGTDIPEFERGQRRAILRGLYDADLTDIVLFGDVDEIPSREALDLIRKQPPASPVVLQQLLYYYSVNWFQGMWNGTIAMPRGLGKLDFQAIRDTRNMLPRIPRGGFHFSWLGDAVSLGRKLRCHTVAWDAQHYGSKDIVEPKASDMEFLNRCRDTGEDLFGRAWAKKQYVPVIPSATHPHTIESWILQHPQYRTELEFQP